MESGDMIGLSPRFSFLSGPLFKELGR